MRVSCSTMDLGSSNLIGGVTGCLDVNERKKINGGGARVLWPLGLTVTFRSQRRSQQRLGIDEDDRGGVMDLVRAA